jgi:hypothetical protein
MIIIIMQEVWGRTNLLLSFNTTRAANKKRLGDTKAQGDHINLLHFSKLVN